MQRAIEFISTAAVLLLTGEAFATDLPLERAQYAGHAYVDMQTGNVTWASPDQALLAGVDVYSNIASPVVGAISSTDLSSFWGDRVTTTGFGVLSQNDFTIYNSGSSAGPLLTANVVVDFFNFATSTFLGVYTVGINFGTGIPPGSYTVVSVINLDPAAINLNGNDILEIQYMAATSGTANRLGVASLDPVTVGSSPNTMYINSPTIGPAGFYTLDVPANPGYRINTILPVPTQPTTWGKVKSLYR